MALLFSGTIRSLNVAATRRRRIAIGVALLVLCAWGVWAFAARISIVAVSRRARLQARHAVHHLAMPASGNIAVANVALGRTVRRGEILIELDTREEVIRGRRFAAEVANLERRISAMNGQIAAAKRLSEAQARSGEARLRQAMEQTAEARQHARIERARADQAARLRRDGLVSQTEADESAQRAEAEEARVRALVVAEEQARRMAGEVAAAAEASLRELESDRIELEQQLAVARNAHRSADLAVERLRVRSPANGRVISSSEPRPGAWVAAGEKLCSIAPDELIEVAAWFPLESMPMIHAGQPATVWINSRAMRTRSVARATVTAVELDPSGSEFQVRLRLDRIPEEAAGLDQGFPAVAVVEIERVTPFGALLRAAGMVPTGT